MLAIQVRSTHPVSHVAFSPDGTTFAVGQPHTGVTLCDRASGQALTTMSVSRAGELTSVVFCDGGRKLAASFYKGFYVFEVATGAALARQSGYTLSNAVLATSAGGLLAVNYRGLREVQLPQAPHEPIRSLSRPLTTRSARVGLSPCGRWVFGVYERIGPSLTSTVTGKFAATIEHPYRNRNNYHDRVAVAFAADGSRLAVCDGNDVVVYDTPTETPDEDDELASVQGAGLPVAPKPRLLLEPVFRIGPPEDFRPAARPRLDFVDEVTPPNPRWYPPVAFTPDGRRLLVRRPRNRVQLWDVATASCAAEWSWRIEVTCLAVAPDGLTAVAGGRFGRAVAWDME
jgi:WD40 repeat protein